MAQLIKSFGKRLRLQILLAVVAIFSCIAAMYYSYGRKHETEMAIRYSSVLLGDMIKSLNMDMLRVEHAVSSSASVIMAGLDTPDSLMSIVCSTINSDNLIMGGGIAFSPNRYPQKGRWFMEYATVDSMGNYTFKHLNSIEYDYFSMEWYSKPASTGKTWWSSPYFDKGAGNRLMTTFSMPLSDSNGQLIAVITADVHLERFVQKLKTLRPYPDSRTFIINRSDGTFLSHPDTKLIYNATIYKYAGTINNPELWLIGKKMMKGQSGTECLHFNKSDAVASFMPMPNTPWSVCTISPMPTILQQLGTTTTNIIIILIIGVITLMFLIRIVIARATAPIKKITDAAYNIAAGNLNTPLPEIETDNEFRRLRDAFAHMQQSLKTYIERLTETTRHQQRTDSELEIAQKIQLDMLPKTFPPYPDHDEFDIYSRLITARMIGGDFYDFHLRDNKLFFVIGDVAGKGVPASIIMAVSRSMFKSALSQTTSPAHIISIINDSLAENNAQNMFVTMICGVLNLADGHLCYCSAGHNAPLIWDNEKGTHALPCLPNIPAGLFGGYAYENQTTKLLPGQKIILYTDGVTEAMSANKQMFGVERMKSTINSSHKYNSHVGAKELVNDIFKAIHQYTGTIRPNDDIAIMAITYNRYSEKSPDIAIRKELTIINDIEEIAALNAFILSIGRSQGWDDSTIKGIKLALEEAVSNIILYAYAPGVKGRITIVALCHDGEAEFRITDSGQPFNPLEHEVDIDTKANVDNRGIGGLGIFLMRRYMSQLSYEHSHNTNNLILKRIINK